MAVKPGPLRPHEERQNYARRKYVDPLPGTPDIGDSFLVVTEGEVTERLYFEGIRDLLQMGQVSVRVIHPDCTDVMGLIRKAIELRDNHKPSGNRDVRRFDHVWVLFDTDVPERDGQLSEALELARREGIHLGHSTPSVELWLLLHFRDRPGLLLSSDAAEHALGEAWGRPYDKSKITFEKLWVDLQSRIPVAVSRAEQTRRYHKEAGTPFPENPSTQLDLLVRALNGSVRPEMRIL